MTTFKNSIGRVLLAGLIYTVGMVGCFILMYDVLIGIVGGVVAGIIFTIVMIVINAKNIKRGEAETKKMSESTRVICDGNAQVVVGKIFGNDGWLMLCENEFVFKAKKMNFDNRSITIPLERIRNFKVQGSRSLTIECIDKSFNFNVVKPKQWKEIAHNHILSKINA